MDSGRIGTRELARRSSMADTAPQPAAAAQTCEQSLTQLERGSLNTPGFRASEPVSIARQQLLPLASLQRATPYEKRNIAEFLTFKDAISLMLASSDIHSAIQADRSLRLDEISPSLQRLGFDQTLGRIGSLDAEISEIQRQIEAGAFAAGPPANTARRGISFAGLSFQIRRSAKQQTEAPMEAMAREKKGQRAQLARQMETFEPAVQNVVFHFAFERQNGPRAIGTAAQMYAPPATISNGLQEAIAKGDVELLRAGVREFLSLPERLMPNARKIACLRQPLNYFGSHRCGRFETPELWRYEAVIAYVDEIVSSENLSASEKSGFCHTLERLEVPDGRAIERDLFGRALFYGNPAVAAAVLLGIGESSATPALKQSLLHGIGSSWGGLGACVDFVKDMLRPYEYRASDWIGGVIAQIDTIKPLPQLSAETKS